MSDMEQVHLGPLEPLQLPRGAEPLGDVSSHHGFMVCASKTRRGSGRQRASGGQYSTGMGVVEKCVKLHCIGHESSSSLPRWLRRGPPGDTNFGLSAAPLSGHG